MSKQIMARLRAHRHPYPDEHVSYPGNGHVIQLPNEPTSELVPPGFPNGGNPVDAAHAARAAWTVTLRFLDDNLACTPPPVTPSGFDEQLEDLHHEICRQLTDKIDLAAHGRHRDTALNAG